jgi:hypothetical protein
MNFDDEILSEVIRLIKVYGKKVKEIYELLSNLYEDKNLNPLQAKAIGLISKTGYLDDGKIFSYNFHGIGCYVEFGDYIVDFDFTLIIFGNFIFHHLWLKSFLGYNKRHFPFIEGLTSDDLKEVLIELFEDRKLKISPNNPKYFHLVDEHLQKPK